MKSKPKSQASKKESSAMKKFWAEEAKEKEHIRIS